MSESVYRKTALPAKLDLSNRNTAEQLKTGTVNDGRGELEGVASAKTAAKSQKSCSDLMRKDLQDWLARHGITGPPPSAEAEHRAMWTWMRDFHKEYNDDWWARNMPRLLEQFRPIFNEEMKRMKAAAKPKEVKQPGGDDLLDFGGTKASADAAPPAASSGSDLLGFDSPSPAANTQASPPAAASDAGLLLDFGAPQVPVAAPAPAAAPSLLLEAPAASAPAAASSNPNALFDLGGLGDAWSSQSPAAAPAPSTTNGLAGANAFDLSALTGAVAGIQAGAAAAPQASPASAKKGDDLMDLFG